MPSLTTCYAIKQLPYHSLHTGRIYVSCYTKKNRLYIHKHIYIALLYYNACSMTSQDANSRDITRKW